MSAETKVNAIDSIDFQGTPDPQKITCMSMSSSPLRDQNTTTSSTSNRPMKRIVYSSSSDDDVVHPNFVSNITPSQINYWPAELSQSFGITAEKKILPLKIFS